MHNNIIKLLVLLAGTAFVSIEAIQFTFKGGSSNTIDIALFKNRNNFEEFIERVGGSKESARAVEAFTKENTAIIASTGAALVTGVALIISQGTLTPAAAAINALAVGGLTAATLLSGKFAHVGAAVIKSFAKDYASHYVEDMTLQKINKSLCCGIIGDKLVRRRDFPLGTPNYMDFTEPQPMYLVIFNKEVIKDPYNPKTIISEPYTVIFAGEIKPEHLSSAFDIRTEVVSYYDTDKYGKPKLDESGFPIVLERAVGVRLDITDKDGGLICANSAPIALKATAHIKWAAGLNHILKNNLAINNSTKPDYDKEIATRIVNQLTQATKNIPESPQGHYLLADNKKVSVKKVQDAIGDINTLITHANNKTQLNAVVKAIDNLLKDFEYYVKLNL